MKWIELLLATALFAALMFLGRYLLVDFRSGVARTRFWTFERMDQPAWFWLVTIFNAVFFSLVIAASLAALIGAYVQFVK